MIRFSRLQKSKLDKVIEASIHFLNLSLSVITKLINQIRVIEIRRPHFGKPFSENIGAYNQAKNVKFDFNVISAIQAKSLTIGEFVAHLLPYSSLEDLASNISILISADFLAELKSFKKQSIHEHVNEQIHQFSAKAGEVFDSVKQTYELRNIFCHEFATNVMIDETVILRNFSNCKVFLNQVNLFIQESIYPHMPETQSGMNQKAYGDFDIFEEELRLLIEEIIEYSKQRVTDNFFNDELFNKSMENWREYRKAHAEHAAHFVLGGTMYPTLYASDMTFITREKITSLKSEFDYLLRKMRKK